MADSFMLSNYVLLFFIYISFISLRDKYLSVVHTTSKRVLEFDQPLIQRVS